jgi:predicted kinase
MRSAGITRLVNSLAMPRLILLNGPPGCGKSTLARMYVDDHPFVLDLDIDLIRAQIGQWHSDPAAAGRLARAITLAAARTHLGADHDVVVPQFLGRIEFIERLDQVARDAGAEFREIALTDSKQNAIRRHARRQPGPLWQPVTEDELSDMYDRLMSVIAARPGTKLVPTTDGEPTSAYRALLDALSP